MEMQHELFYSKFKPLVGRPPLLDIIRDSPLGENPHRAAAMGLIFERTIHDCRERALVQEKKISGADTVIQPDNYRKATSTFTTPTQPAIVQPPQEKVQASQPPKVQLPYPLTQPLSKPTTQSTAPQTTSNVFGSFGPKPTPPQTIPNFFISLPTSASTNPPQTSSPFNFASQANRDRK